MLLIGNGFGKRAAKDWIKKRRQFLQFWFTRIRLCSVVGSLSFTWPEIYGIAIIINPFLLLSFHSWF